MKKHIILTVALFASVLTSAQVAIGKPTVNGTNTILDFYDDATNVQGIILPTLAAAPTLSAANNGTFYYDTTEKKVKMYEDNKWVEISEEGTLPTYFITNTSNETIPNAQKQGVIIGSDTSSAEGVLVLESSDKALVLPKIVSPESKVVDPYPGMMCYDTASKSLAIFDGENWNYWKARQ